MNAYGVTFGGYLAKILSFKTGNLLNNSKFNLLLEGTVIRTSSIVGCIIPEEPRHFFKLGITQPSTKM